MKINSLSVLRKLILLTLFVGVSVTGFSAAGPTYTLPSYLKNVKRPVISLSGTWDFRYSPESAWTTIHVPGEAVMQGFGIRHDTPFVYKKTITIPADFKKQQCILRFDGVYSYAKLSVNGKYVREHFGGFTRWETDITPYIHVGKKNEIRLEVTDRLDEISYASGYAHHPIGGILRDVTLFALPSSHVYDTSITTALDSLYQDAQLHYSCYFKGKRNTKISFRLTDPNGKVVSLNQSTFELKPGKNSFSLPIKAPVKWDAEHPNLYLINVSILKNNDILSTTTGRIGFRDIKIKGNQMLVNGKPVKLRGACRHDMHPLLGRTTTRELDSLDVILFKQSNMNFVRTSHYPPTERFLEFCDRYGIYVECETAVCFVDTHRQKNYAPGNSQDNPDFTNRYLGQFREMVKSMRNHPSILFWSIGNESQYGHNFQVCRDWVKQEDPTRPSIFSYPGLAMKKKADMFDIVSMHYQDVYGNLEQWGVYTRNFETDHKPVVFDEWAHPACYTYATLQTDPNIREFWGKSLDMMWDGVFRAKGALGGAIWGYIDETFSVPSLKVGTPFWKEFARTSKPKDVQGNCVGYGEWGIVDVWRRKKPEFWSTQKAYSPVRLQADDHLSYVTGQPIYLPILNRYDHTNLNEIKAFYTYKGNKKEITLKSLEPHLKGLFTIPAEQWTEGESVFVEFRDKQKNLIDAYKFTLGKEKINYPPAINGTRLTIKEDEYQLLITGKGFQIPFDKTTGLITKATVGNNVIIEKGPFLHCDINLNHLSGAEIRKTADNYKTQMSDWKKTALSYEQIGDVIYVRLKGTYKQVTVDYQFRITPGGEIAINYFTDKLPNGYARETGLSFSLNNSFQNLEWKRKGYWCYYPQGAFAGNEGRTSLYASRQAAYREKPQQPWQADTRNYYYWGDAGANCQQPLTQMAKGMKENIWYYSLSTSSKHQLNVISNNASVACRINKLDNEQLMLYCNNKWDYPEIAWGNYCKQLEAFPCYGNIVVRMK